MENKICKGCLVNKNIKDYYTDRDSLCKVCRNSGIKVGKKDEMYVVYMFLGIFV